MKIKRLSLEYSAQAESVLVREDEAGAFCYWKDMEPLMRVVKAANRFVNELEPEGQHFFDDLEDTLKEIEL